MQLHKLQSCLARAFRLLPGASGRAAILGGFKRRDLAASLLWAGVSPVSAEYEPRSPGATVLYQIVREHFETFRAQMAQLRDGDGLPAFVERAFTGFLRCGWLAGGFARFRCGACGLDRLVAFSCKGRALCPSCSGRRMSERAAHLVDQVLPDVPVRQWVLSLPHRLRYLLAWDHDLCRAVAAVLAQAVFRQLQSRARQCPIVEYFVRRGVPTYVVDHAGRARSGFDPTPTNQARMEKSAASVPSFNVFTNESAWTIFRIGPTAFTPYPSTKFPVTARDQYFAQIVPNTETTYEEGGLATIAALVALVDRIGPSVVVVHSQSGGYGLGVAVQRPAVVKAIVSVEPRVCAVPDADLAALARIPLLTMFGDFFGTDVGDWPGRMAECVATVNKITAAKGTAENVHLPARGIPGNSHMLMMDTNNQQLADMILSWLDRHARVR